MGITGTVDVLESLRGELNKTQTVSGELSDTSHISGSVTANNITIETDYNEIKNKPQIEGNELVGNKTFKQLGISTLTEQEIEKLLYL